MVQLFVKFWLYSSSENLALCRKKNKVLQVSVKKSNTLNYLIFWYFMNIRYFVTCFFKNWQYLALCSSQIKRLIIPKCAKKIHVQKVFIKKTLLACPSGPTIQAILVKWYPRNFVQKFICNFGKVFKNLWNFGYVQDKFNGPEIS